MGKKARHWTKPQTAKSYVYFVQGQLTGLIKIGFTEQDVNSRISSMQTGSPDRLKLLGMLPGSRVAEVKLHRRFAEDRDHGEWFRPSEALLEFIDQNVRKPEGGYRYEIRDVMVR